MFWANFIIQSSSGVWEAKEELNDPEKTTWVNTIIKESHE